MCRYCENVADIYKTDEFSIIVIYELWGQEEIEGEYNHLFKFIGVNEAGDVTIKWYSWIDGQEKEITYCPHCERELNNY